MPPNEFENHERLAFDAFRREGDTTALLVLADRADEESLGRYAALLRFVADPPLMYADLRRDGHEAVRWFLGNMGMSQDSQGREAVFRMAGRQAWAEVTGIRHEIMGRWRWRWLRDGYGVDVLTWMCALDKWTEGPPIHPYRTWVTLDSLSAIDLGSNGRVPAGPIADVKWGVPYGPDPYCRVVMADLAAGHVEMPDELKPPKIELPIPDWPKITGYTKPEKNTRGSAQKANSAKRKRRK